MKLIKMYRVYCILTALAFLSGCSSLSADVEKDTYRYLQPPVKKQLADLNDDDFDGVINARDLCDSTTKGAKIDNNGCGHILKDSNQKRLNILFARNSSVVNPIFLSQIKSMANFLSNYPSATIELKGHTSLLGKEEANLRLSKNRANMVKSWLIHYGVAPEKVTIVGLGEKNPVVSQESEIADAYNRRVTARIVINNKTVEKQWSIFSKIPKNADFY